MCVEGEGDVNVYMYVGGGEGWIADWSGSVDGDWVGR